MDFRDHILSTNSACDDIKSIVEQLCEETLFDACYGRGVVWSLDDYSYIPLAYEDGFHLDYIMRTPMLFPPIGCRYKQEYGTWHSWVPMIDSMV